VTKRGDLQVVTGGELRLTVLWHGWRVFSEALDLCSATSCPMQQGAVTIANQHKLPSIAPPGAYSIKLEATSDGEGGRQLMCLDMFFDVQRRPPAWGKRWLRWLPSTGARA
jgi:hypothetical protein